MKALVLAYLVVFTMFAVPAQQGFVPQAFALTITWDGNSDGDGDGISWSDPLNWNFNLVPESTDIIKIPSSSTVNLDVDFTASNSIAI